MSFPKASRFQETPASCAPPVGSYDPQLLESQKAAILQRAERFKTNLHDASSSSLDTSRLVLRTPAARRATVLPLNHTKQMELEKEIRRLLKEKCILSKELSAKDDEMKKLEGRLNIAIRERNHHQANNVGFERELKELHKTTDILKAKLNSLDSSRKKDVHFELANLHGQLVAKDHEMKDLRIEMKSLRGELENKVLALGAKELELAELQKTLSNALEVEKEKVELAKHESSLLEEKSKALESFTEENALQTEELENQLEDLKAENLRLSGEKDEISVRFKELQKDIGKLHDEADLASAVLREENISLWRRIESQASQQAVSTKEAEVELNRAYENISTSEDCTHALQEYRDALVNRIAHFKASIEELETLHMEDTQFVINTKIEMKELVAALQGKERSLSEANISNSVLKELLEESRRSQQILFQDMENLLSKYNGLELAYDTCRIEGREKEETLQAELLIAQLSLQSATNEILEFKETITDLKTQLNVKQDIEDLNVKQIESLHKQIASEVQDLNSKNEYLEFILTRTSEEKIMEFTDLEMKLQEIEIAHSVEKQVAESIINEKESELASIKQMLQLLQDSLERKDLELRDLKKTLIITEDALLETQNSYQDLAQKMEEEVDSLRKQLQTLEVALKEFGEKEEEHNAAVKNLQEELAKFKQSDSEIKEELARADQALNKERQLVDEKNGEIKDLEGKLACQGDLLVSLEKRLKEEEIAKDSESETIVQLKEELNALKIYLQSKEAILDSTKVEAQVQTERVAILQLQQEELEKEMEKLKTELDEANINHGSLVEDLKTTTDELSKIMQTCNIQQDIIAERQLDVKQKEVQLKQLMVENQRHRANAQWFSDRERDLLVELDLVEQKGQTEKAELTRLLTDAQKRLLPLEMEHKQLKEMKEMEGRQNEDILQALTNEYESRMKLLETVIKDNEENKESSSHWKKMYDELRSKVDPFLEQIDAYEAERQALLSFNNEATQDIAKLSAQYAKLLGHQNQKQKIHHVMKLNDENLKLKKENGKLLEQVFKLKKNLNRMEERLNSTLGVKKFDPAKAFQHDHKENTAPLQQRN